MNSSGIFNHIKTICKSIYMCMSCYILIYPNAMIQPLVLVLKTKIDIKRSRQHNGLVSTIHTIIVCYFAVFLLVEKIPWYLHGFAATRKVHVTRLFVTHAHVDSGRFERIGRVILETCAVLCYCVCCLDYIYASYERWCKLVFKQCFHSLWGTVMIKPPWQLKQSLKFYLISQSSMNWKYIFW